MKNLHLICNAHLDPVWLWEIEEGIAETLSTFRVAADFCNEYDGFVFNHNEAILYQWVEEHDPDLFSRIQRLVKEKKWHIMGGWYLQPDCNMPAGESFVRQILAGKYYFLDKFGVEPQTCINFDAFGHSRGLVEILKKSNYHSYIFCRPEPDMIDLPDEVFEWVGYQGSKLVCTRAFNSYESHRGEAHEKIKGWMENNLGRNPGMVLWGIGNHGGGPSRIDYENIEKLNQENGEYRFIQSTPEQYFEELAGSDQKLPSYAGILNPRYIGCYTSQIRIKQLHRQLENEIYMTEKMLSHAASEGRFDYPKERVDKAIKDLLLVEFHDILPGSAIPEVEEYSVGLAGHGLEEIKQLKAKAFFALCQGQEKAKEGDIPIFAYNPHPFPVEEVFECEFQLPDQNKNRDIFANPVVYQNGKKIPCQVEQESSNFNVDWRKKSVFRAKLEPAQINRFEVQIELIKEEPKPILKEKEGYFQFQTEELEVWINTKTGLVDKYIVEGIDHVKENAFAPLVMQDDDNSWSHKEKSIRNLDGKFTLMSKERGSEFTGVQEGTIESVRVIEEGAVRTIIEAVLEYEHSHICQRYILPKKGTQMKVWTKVYWNEIMKMLKLSIPTRLDDPQFIGQTAYGQEVLLTNGDEMVSQKWNLLTDETYGISVINSGTYGSDCKDGELRLSLLRSPGYSAGKSDFSFRHKYIMPQDRFSPYIDQGERTFECWFNVSKADDRQEKVERESLVVSEKPYVLSFFPTGAGQKSQCFATLSDDAIVLSTLKKCEKQDAYILRLFNPTSKVRQTTLSVPKMGLQTQLELEGYEIKSLKVDVKNKDHKIVDLMERDV